MVCINDLLYEKLKEHAGHRVEIAEYGNGDNFSLEDIDTDEVIFDTDGYDLIADEPTVEFITDVVLKSGNKDTMEVDRNGNNDYTITFKVCGTSVRGSLTDIYRVAKKFCQE